MVQTNCTIRGGITGHGRERLANVDACSIKVAGKEKFDDRRFSLILMFVVAFLRLNWRYGPTSSVRNSHFSGGCIFKNVLRTFESAIWRDWNWVSAVFRWSLSSGGRKDRFNSIFLCVVLATAYVKYRQCHLSRLPFIWHFLFNVTHPHTHTLGTAIVWHHLIHLHEMWLHRKMKVLQTNSAQSSVIDTEESRHSQRKDQFVALTQCFTTQ